MRWMIFEWIFSFLEILISCFLATGIFRKSIKGKKTILALILFSVFGAALLTVRAYVFTWIPDFLPAVLVFTLYAIIICEAKWWSAVSWALVNYLFIGVIVITTNYVLSMCLYLPVQMGKSDDLAWLFSGIFSRIGQFLLSEIILCVWKRFPVSNGVHRGNWKIMIRIILIE